MKVPLSRILIFLCALSLLLVPVTAITTGTGNTPGIQPTGVILTSDPTSMPTIVPTFVSPVDVSQNVGIVPIWLIIGIILIIIALSGLLWRYFHPKYVPPEEKE